MKKMTFGWQALAVLAVAGMALTADAQIQKKSSLKNLRGGSTATAGVGTAAGADAGGGSVEEGKVEINRFPTPGKAGMIKVPEFQVNVAGMQSPIGGRKREWALFEVKYSTGAKWTDELAFTYHVLCKGRDEKTRSEVYSYYTATVRYTDVPKGPHMSCVVLPPNLVERYGDPVAVALEIMGKSEILASQHAESGMSLPKEWWKDSKVMDDKRLTRRNGLVDKSKTPFALINLNDYEVVQ
jgi:hypothetical protein